MSSICSCSSAFRRADQRGNTSRSTELELLFVPITCLPGPGYQEVNVGGAGATFRTFASHLSASRMGAACWKRGCGPGFFDVEPRAPSSCPCDFCSFRINAIPSDEGCVFQASMVMEVAECDAPIRV